MTKLEYWKSVQDGDFIQACKDAGINLVSTNVSDARAELICMDIKSVLGVDYFKSKEILLDLFLVGLKLKNLTSYEYGKLFTLEARLDEESTQDRIPYEIDYEGTIKIDKYIIKTCKTILNTFPKRMVESALNNYLNNYSFDETEELDWWGLIYQLITNNGNGSLECDAYLLGKMYDVLKVENLNETLVVNTISILLSSINYDSINSEELSSRYGSLRSYFLGEDPSYEDFEYISDEKGFLSRLDPDIYNVLYTGCDKSKCIDIDKLLKEFDADDYEDELEDNEEDDEETEYGIEMKAIEASENIVSNSCQSVKLETEPESSPISVEQKVKSQPAKIEIPDYNGLTVVSNLIKVAESDSLRNDHMQGLFTVGMDGNEIKLLVDIIGGIYLEKEVLDRLGKEYIKDVLIRFTTPNGSYSEDLEFFNKWNKVVGFLKMMDI